MILNNCTIIAFFFGLLQLKSGKVLSQSCGAKCSECTPDKLGSVFKAVCVDTRINSLPDSVEELYLSDGKPNLIPVGLLKDYLFIGKENLHIVQIKNYGINMVWGSPFVNCTNLQSIDFSDNHIASFSKSNLHGPVSLLSLNLNNNRLSRISNNAFSNQLTLTKLYLSHNRISSVSRDSLSGLNSLTLLDLSYNKIGSIELQAFQSLGKIETIYLQNNQIVTIPDALFGGLVRLSFLYLQNNLISSLAETAVDRTNISMLNISENKLSDFPTKVVLAISSKFVAADLSYNLITKLSQKALSNVTMETLDLKFNKISIIDAGAFQNSHIHKINLYHNLLQTLPSTMENYLRTVHPTVVLAENPWMCDCPLLWFAKYQTSRIGTASVDNILCQDPSKYSGQNIQDQVLNLETECVTTAVTSQTTVVSHGSTLLTVTVPSSTKTSLGVTSLVASSVASPSSSDLQVIPSTSVSLNKVSTAKTTIQSQSTVKTASSLATNGPPSSGSNFHLSPQINNSNEFSGTTNMSKLANFEGKLTNTKSVNRSEEHDNSGGIIGGVVAAILICVILVGGFLLYRKHKVNQRANRVSSFDEDEEETDSLHGHLNLLDNKNFGPSKLKFDRSYLQQ